jgi:hypothetical protein
MESMMETYRLAAARVGWIELAVEHYFVGDDSAIADYRGPQLIVIAHAERVVTIHELGRQVDELAIERAVELIDLGIAACAEPQADLGFDTAIGRPTTRYRLRVYRALPETTATLQHAVNHYAPRALGPTLSRFLVALRETIGPLPATATSAWDDATRWLARG